MAQSRPIKIGSWGGSGGEPRDLDSPPHPIRLVRVTVTDKEVVHSIQFTYVDSNNQEHTVGPWGGTAGKKNATIELGRFEHIVHVSGTVGQWADVPRVITSLKFVTNKNQKFEYGESHRGSSVFDIPLEEGEGKILGFFGRSGYFLDAIGVYAGHTE